MSALKDSGFVNSPALTRFLGKIGTAVSEGAAPRSETPPGAPKTESNFPYAEQIGNMENPFYRD